jgi:hypothetical protein
MALGRRCAPLEASGERRERIWEAGLRVYPGFAQYERRAAHREIAVFVLEPAGWEDARSGAV